MNIKDFNMEKDDLDRLLEKYYEGLTTREEESDLREFFRTGAVPDEYEAEKEIFRYYDENAEVPEPSPGFESRILAGIEEAGKAGRSSGPVRRLIPYLSIAAGLLIITGSWFFFVHRNEPKDTFTDPQVAYAQTMKILLDVSAKMNHGTRTLEPLGRLDAMTVQSMETIKTSTGKMGRNIRDLGTVLESLGQTEKQQNEKVK